MVESILSTLLLWGGFLIFTAIVFFIAVIGAYYGLKLIDKTERWYKGTDHDEPPK